MVSQNGKVHYSTGSLFCWLLQDLVVWPRFGDPFVFQNPQELSVSHFLRRVQGCAYTICSYDQIKISCTIPSGSPSPPSCVLSDTFFMLICCIRLLCDWSFRLNQHKIYIRYFVAFCLFLLWHSPYAVVCAAIRGDLVPFLVFRFLSHVQLFSCEISVVGRSKCSYSCFFTIFVFWLFFSCCCLCCLYRFWWL